jgi:hypothetical protein
MVAAYDDNVYADFGAVTPTTPQVSGFYSMLSPKLDFQKPGDKLRLGVTATTNARYYRDGSRVLTTGSAIGAGFTARVGRSTSVSLNQGVTYSPAYLYGLFASVTPPAAGDTVPPAPDYAVSSPDSYAYSTTASIDREVSTRTSLVVDGNFGFSDFSDKRQGYSDLRSRGAGGRLVRALDRNLKLRVGYRYEGAEYSPTFRPVKHGPDIGIDYTRVVSQTRRVTFGLTLGPRVLNGSDSAAVAAADRQYALTGDASLNRQLNRTWTVGAGFNRAVSFVEGLNEPLMTNGATASVGGFLNRRTDVALLAAGSFGESYAGAPFRTATGDLRLRFALSRILAANVGYLFYFYDFDKSYVLPPGVSSRLTRNGVRAGMTLWAPLRH